MTENRATEYLPRCYGVYSDISCGNCPYRRYEKEGRGCIYALHEDALALLKEQGQTINELEEKLRLLEYGDQDILQSGMMPAT